MAAVVFCLQRVCKNHSPSVQCAVQPLHTECGGDREQEPDHQPHTRHQRSEDFLYLLFHSHWRKSVSNINARIQKIFQERSIGGVRGIYRMYRFARGSEAHFWEFSNINVRIFFTVKMRFPTPTLPPLDPYMNYD